MLMANVNSVVPPSINHHRRYSTGRSIVQRVPLTRHCFSVFVLRSNNKYVPVNQRLIGCVGSVVIGAQ